MRSPELTTTSKGSLHMPPDILVGYSLTPPVSKESDKTVSSQQYARWAPDILVGYSLTPPVPKEAISPGILKDLEDSQRELREVAQQSRSEIRVLQSLLTEAAAKEKQLVSELDIQKAARSVAEAKAREKETAAAAQQAELRLRQDALEDVKHEYQSLQDQLKLVAERATTIQNELNAATAQIKKLEGAVAKADQTTKLSEEAYQRLAETINHDDVDAQAAQDVTVARLAELRRQLTELQKENTDLSRDIASKTSQIEEHGHAVAVSQALTLSLIAERDQAQGLLRQANEAFTVTVKSHEELMANLLEQFNSTYNVHQTAIATARQEVVTAIQAKDEAETAALEAMSKLEEATTKSAADSTTISQLNRRLHELTERTAAAQATADQATTRVNELEEQNRQLTGELQRFRDDPSVARLEQEKIELAESLADKERELVTRTEELTTTSGEFALRIRTYELEISRLHTTIEEIVAHHESTVVELRTELARVSVPTTQTDKTSEAGSTPLAINEATPRITELQAEIRTLEEQISLQQATNQSLIDQMTADSATAAAEIERARQESTTTSQELTRRLDEATAQVADQTRQLQEMTESSAIDMKSVQESLTQTGLQLAAATQQATEAILQTTQLTTELEAAKQQITEAKAEAERLATLRAEDAQRWQAERDRLRQPGLLQQLLDRLIRPTPPPPPVAPGPVAPKPVTPATMSEEAERKKVSRRRLLQLGGGIATTITAAVVLEKVISPPVSQKTTETRRAFIESPSLATLYADIKEPVTEQLFIERGSLIEDKEIIHTGSIVHTGDLLDRWTYLARELAETQEDHLNAATLIKYRNTILLCRSAKDLYPQAVKFQFIEKDGKLTIIPLDWKEKVAVRREIKSDLVIAGGEIEAIVAAMHAVKKGMRPTLIYQTGKLGGLNSDTGANMAYFDAVNNGTVKPPEEMVELFQIGLGMPAGSLISLNNEGLDQKLHRFLKTHYPTVTLIPTRTLNSTHTRTLTTDVLGKAPRIELVTEEGTQIHANNMIDMSTECLIGEKLGLDMTPDTPNLAYGMVFDIKNIKHPELNATVKDGRLHPDKILVLMGLTHTAVDEHEELKPYYRECLAAQSKNTNYSPSESWGYAALGNAFNFYMKLQEFHGPAELRGIIKELNQLRLVDGFNVAYHQGDRATFNSISWKFKKRLYQSDHSVHTDPEFAAIRQVEIPLLQQFMRQIVGNDSLTVVLPQEMYVRQATAHFPTSLERTRHDLSHTPLGDPEDSFKYYNDYRGLTPRNQWDTYPAELKGETPVYMKADPRFTVTVIPGVYLVNKNAQSAVTFGIGRIQQNLALQARATVDAMSQGRLEAMARPLRDQAVASTKRFNPNRALVARLIQKMPSEVRTV